MRHRIKSEKISIFKSVTETPSKYAGHLCPVNLEEEKQRFLQHGILPKFVLNNSAETVSKLLHRDRGQIRFDYLNEAKHVLELVRQKYGDGGNLIEQTYGPRIDHETASGLIANYLKEHGLQGEITTYWTEDLNCTARMMWHGPNLRFNKPEARKYTLIIKNSTDNNLLRENGITCLINHEVGTHYFRMVNDGLQPWFSNRKLFSLRPAGCRESCATEEGLAAINTIVQSQNKYLWTSAILYYTACMAKEMSFKELFDHLERFVASREQRWKHVMRVKRALAEPNDPGGYGVDQCYFEGAVEILRNVDNIDFYLLYSGKVCHDELPRVRRLARMDCIKAPNFLKNIEKYKKTLRHIALLNGLTAKPEKQLIQIKPAPKRLFNVRKLNGPFFHTPTPPPSDGRRQHDYSPTNNGVPTSALCNETKTSQGKRRSGIKSAPSTESTTMAESVDISTDWVDEEEATPVGAGLGCSSERLLNRPKSHRNRIVKKRRKHKVKQNQDPIGNFGLLDRSVEY